MKRLNYAVRKLQVMTLLGAEPCVCFKIAKEFKVDTEKLLQTYNTEPILSLEDIVGIKNQNAIYKEKTYRLKLANKLFNTYCLPK